MTASEVHPNHAAPWLAVVMPVHNGADYLETALDSLVAESCHGVQIIIIDSSGDDRCTRIVERFQEKLSIDYSYRPDAKPWPIKTNIAVQSTPAPLVCMLHQDDIWLPGRLKWIWETVSSFPDMSMYLSPSYIIDSRGRRLGLWRCPLAEKKIWGRGEILERLLVQNFIAIPTPVISRESWIAVGGMDENLWYTADWDLYLKLSRINDVFYNPVPTASFRIHTQSLTVKGSKEIVQFRKQINSVIERHIWFVPMDRRESILKLSKSSMAINVALAAAMAGKLQVAFQSILDDFRFNLKDSFKLIIYSRLFERVVPRLLAKLL